MKDKKQRILNLLKREKKPISTSKIATKIKSNHWMTLKYLELLQEEGKIERIEQLSSNYWKIKKSPRNGLKSKKEEPQK